MIKIVQLFLLLTLFVFATEKPTLTIYTYDAFAASWGPAPKIKQAFEKEHHCNVKFVGLSSSIGALRKIQLEGKRTKADILLGLDTSIAQVAKKTGLFVPHELNTTKLELPAPYSDDTFIPFDYSFFAFVYDVNRLKNVPDSFEALATMPKDFKIVIQDPRSSTAGLGLLLWVKSVYGDKAGEYWKRLAPHILTITKGWSEAYGLFLKGGINGGGTTSTDGGITSNTYSLVDGKNSAIMGALKNANVKVYKYTNIDTIIAETTTGNLGEFSLSLTAISDTELLLVEVRGGFDIDTNDDGELDSSPTENRGMIRGWVKASELKNGNVNVTLLSEVVYNYTKHLISQVHQDDFEQALDSITKRLFKSSETAASYDDIKSFNPLKSDMKSKLSFDYTDLIKENSLASFIHSDSNDTVLTEKLTELFRTKLSFNAIDLIQNKSYYKVTLIPGLKTDFAANTVNIFVRNESNESKLNDFVSADGNVTFTATPNEEMKIIDWDGCNKISEDKTQCTVINIQEDKTIMPRIQYKENVYSDNVKDLTGYTVAINDNNYTVNLDLDTDSTTRAFIEGIVTDDIIIKRDGDTRFFRKIVSVNKVDDYNYIFITDDMFESFWE